MIAAKRQVGIFLEAKNEGSAMAKKAEFICWEI